jgi:hypothetical protein
VIALALLATAAATQRVEAAERAFASAAFRRFAAPDALMSIGERSDDDSLRWRIDKAEGGDRLRVGSNGGGNPTPEHDAIVP